MISPSLQMILFEEYSLIPLLLVFFTISALNILSYIYITISLTKSVEQSWQKNLLLLFASKLLNNLLQSRRTITILFIQSLNLIPFAWLPRWFANTFPIIIVTKYLQIVAHLIQLQILYISLNYLNIFLSCIHSNFLWLLTHPAYWLFWANW